MLAEQEGDWQTALTLKCGALGVLQPQGAHQMQQQASYASAEAVPVTDAPGNAWQGIQHCLERLGVGALLQAHSAQQLSTSEQQQRASALPPSATQLRAGGELAQAAAEMSRWALPQVQVPRSVGLICTAVALKCK